MLSTPKTGWIEVICGSMFSGKTEELIRRLRRAQIARQKVQVFKPEIDERYSKDHIASHSEQRLGSVMVAHAKDLLSKVADHTRVVGIDEVQFFEDDIVDVASRLADRGMRVILAGLDLDYLGQPFGPMPRLLALAEQVTKLHAVCVICGLPASRTQKRWNSENALVEVGSHDLYEARCRHCHEKDLTAPEFIVQMPLWAFQREDRDRSE